MSKEPKRTIEEVMDYQTGECVYASKFFNRPLDEISNYRSQLQQAIEGFIEPVFICYYCRQKVRIRGGIASRDKIKEEIYHFAHLKDSDECHIKTKNQYTREEVDRMKYNGAKESILHQTLKGQIAECLFRNEETKNEISNIEVEKIIKDKVAIEWRKPDINTNFKEYRLAFELQLSTTWLNVITKRQHFYKEQGIYIFWVFHSFNVYDQARKLTFDDVIYTNNQNAYVFDDETYKLSKFENDLILKCFYKWYYPDGEYLGEEWKSQFIKLSDLTFDEANYKIYFHDAASQKKEVETIVEQYILKEEQIKRHNIMLLKDREEKTKEIEESISILQFDIEYIDKQIAEIEKKESLDSANLESEENFLINIGDHVIYVVNYFIDKYQHLRPLYGYQKLLESMVEGFKEKVKTFHKNISEKETEISSISERLSGINKIQKVEIGTVIHWAIDKNIDWEFIKNNYQLFLTIKKSLINDLYAKEELKQIKNDFELEQLRYRSDIFFLIDYSEKIKELESKISITEGQLNQNRKEFEALKDEIKQIIETNVSNKITEFKNRINNYPCDIKRLQEKKTELEQRINALKVSSLQ